VEALVLFPLRWFTFKRNKMHYYMFDFCYLVNLLLLVHLWVCPEYWLLTKVALLMTLTVVSRVLFRFCLRTIPGL